MPGGRTPRRGWAIAAVVAAVWGVLATIGVVARAAAGDWFESALALGWARIAYWFAAGAWLRSPWGEPDGDDPLPGPPPLTHARLRRAAVAAGVATAAVVAAFTFQALDGHWFE